MKDPEYYKCQCNIKVYKYLIHFEQMYKQFIMKDKSEIGYFFS